VGGPNYGGENCVGVGGGGGWGRVETGDAELEDTTWWKDEHRKTNKKQKKQREEGEGYDREKKQGEGKSRERAWGEMVDASREAAGAKDNETIEEERGGRAQ